MVAHKQIAPPARKLDAHAPTTHVQNLPQTGQHLMGFRSHILPYSDAPADWEPQWLIKNLVQHQALNFIAGPPKQAHKTSFRRYLLACALAGEKVLDRFEPARKPEHVLILITEDHPGRERRIMDMIFEHFGYEASPPIDFLQPFGLQIDKPRQADQLVRLVEEDAYDLVIIDPLFDFHQADENLSTGMAMVTLALKRLAQFATVIVVHHTGKPSQMGYTDTRTVGEQMRGSGVLAGALDGMIRIHAGRPLEHAHNEGLILHKVELELKLAADSGAFEAILDTSTWLWSLQEALSERAVLREVAREPGIHKKPLTERLPFRRTDVLTLINEMIERGMLIMTNGPRKTCNLWIPGTAPK